LDAGPHSAGHKRWSLRGCAHSLVEPVERMERAHGKLGISSIDEHREFDLGGGDGANVDVARGESLERLRRDAGVTAHPYPDHRTFCHILSAVEAGETDGGLGLAEHVD